MAYIDMTWQKGTIRGEERTAGGGGRGREEVEDELEQSTMLSVHENVIMKPLALHTKKNGKKLGKIPPQRSNLLYI